jgi:hypothetical protein
VVFLCLRFGRVRFPSLKPLVNRLPLVLVARRVLPVGLERLAVGCEIPEEGLDATRQSLLELARGVDAIVADHTVAIGEPLLDRPRTYLPLPAQPTFPTT